MLDIALLQCYSGNSCKATNFQREVSLKTEVFFVLKILQKSQV